MKMNLSRITATAFIVGSAYGYVLGTCQQSSSPVSKCDDCEAGTSGTPYYGWYMIETMDDSCQGQGACEDCCMIAEVVVGGPGAIGAHVISSNTGEHIVDDDGDPMIASLPISSSCLTDVNTYSCATVAGLFTGLNNMYGGKIVCFRLDCQKCGQ